MRSEIVMGYIKPVGFFIASVGRVYQYLRLPADNWVKPAPTTTYVFLGAFTFFAGTLREYPSGSPDTALAANLLGELPVSPRPI